MSAWTFSRVMSRSVSVTPVSASPRVSPKISLIFAPSNDDYAGLGRKRGKLRLDFQAAHLFHPDVENNERHRMGLNMRKKLLWLVESPHRQSIGR